MKLRQKRVAREVAQKISWLLYHQVRDPHLTGVQVTAVLMSPDLSWAKVYWILDTPKVESTVDRRAREQAHQCLEKSQGFFKRHLAQTLRLRRVPQLRFYYDCSLERGQRMQDLLDEVLPPSLPQPP